MMKFSFLRHLTQLVILALFAIGNITALKKLGFDGIRILEGDLSGSRLFGTINLSDPFAILQLFLAGFSISATAITGALIVLVFYALIAPRAFCGWVCPVNIVTDLAHFIREKLGISKSLTNFNTRVRYYLLALSLLLSFIFGIAAFESVSFVGAFTRSIVFGSGSFFAIFVLLLIVDIFVQKRFICTHLCPLGAFWAIVSKFSLIRVKYNVDKCTKCHKCKEVCPEITPLEVVGKKNGFVNSECISCGRCVEACNDGALNFSILNLGGKK